jgi:hypothetical protein
MEIEQQIKKVQDFVFNDEVQNILSQINDNVMDFNILEITGMGSQEIKHSNILGWLFGDNEHNLEYQILDSFLKKVIEKNKDKQKQLEELKHYLYLPENRRNITIFREKDNIDLLLVDEKNEIVITIENKVYASESETQLVDYKNKIDKKYNGYNKYFIFLTINLEKPSDEDNWLVASHQMIAYSIEEILKTKEITTKAKIVLESYVDLLKRNGIVADKELKELCEDIWLNNDYADALNILIQHKTTMTKNFYDETIKKEFQFRNNVYLRLDGSDRIYKKANRTWKNKKDTIYDLTCEYENENIVLYIVYRNLHNQSEEIQKKCKDIIPLKNLDNEYQEYATYTKDDLIKRGESWILKDMKKKIDYFNKELCKRF